MKLVREDLKEGFLKVCDYCGSSKNTILKTKAGEWLCQDCADANDIKFDYEIKKRKKKNESIKEFLLTEEDEDEDPEIAELEAKIKEIRARKEKERLDKKEADRVEKEIQLSNDPLVKQVTDIIESNKEDVEGTVEKLFEILVPNRGNASSTAGELIRAIMKLLYKDYNDGDVFYEGYGIETCGNAIAYIVDKLKSLDKMSSNIEEVIERVVELGYKDDEYTRFLLDLADSVLLLINEKPELIVDNANEDMYESDASWVVDLEPKYEEGFELSSRIIDHVEADNIGNVEWELSDWEEFRGADIEVSGNIVYLSNMTKEQFDRIIDNWDRWLDQWADDLDDEYGIPSEELEDDEDLNESLKENKGFKIIFKSNTEKNKLTENISLNEIIYYVPHVYEDKDGEIYTDIDKLIISKKDGEWVYSSNYFGDADGFENGDEAYDVFNEAMEKEFLNDWGIDFSIVRDLDKAREVQKIYSEKYAKDDLNESVDKKKKFNVVVLVRDENGNEKLKYGDVLASSREEAEHLATIELVDADDDLIRVDYVSKGGLEDYLNTQTVSNNPIKMAYKDAKMSYETGHWIDLSTEEDIEQLITEMMKEENWSRIEAEKYVNEYIRLFDDKDFLDDEDLDESLKIKENKMKESLEKDDKFIATALSRGFRLKRSNGRQHIFLFDGDDKEAVEQTKEIDNAVKGYGKASYDDGEMILTLLAEGKELTEGAANFGTSKIFNLSSPKEEFDEDNYDFDPYVFGYEFVKEEIEGLENYIELKSGYHEGYYIKVKFENAEDFLNEVKDEEFYNFADGEINTNELLEEANKKLNQIKEALIKCIKNGSLTNYSVAYKFSNGETGYQLINETAEDIKLFNEEINKFAEEVKVEVFKEKEVVEKKLTEEVKIPVEEIEKINAEIMELENTEDKTTEQNLKLKELKDKLLPKKEDNKLIIKQALLDLDNEDYNDLVNMYEAVTLTEEERLQLANLLAGGGDILEIYDFLVNKLNGTYEYDFEIGE